MWQGHKPSYSCGLLKWGASLSLGTKQTPRLPYVQAVSPLGESTSCGLKTRGPLCCPVSGPPLPVPLAPPPWSLHWTFPGRLWPFLTAPPVLLVSTAPALTPCSFPTSCCSLTKWTGLCVEAQWPKPALLVRIKCSLLLNFTSFLVSVLTLGFGPL